MKDIKTIIEEAAAEIIEGVDGISEGTVEYDKLMEQLIYIQSVNYKNDNPAADIELPDEPAPLRITPSVRKVAASIDKKNAAKKEQMEQEELEDLEVNEEEAAALRH